MGKEDQRKGRVIEGDSNGLKREIKWVRDSRVS